MTLKSEVQQTVEGKELRTRTANLDVSPASTIRKGVEITKGMWIILEKQSFPYISGR